MKKAIIITIAMLFLSNLTVWAADTTTYIRLYESSFDVDLSSKKYLSHLDGSTYSSNKNSENKRKDGFYYQNQELGVVGLSDTNYYDTDLGDLVFTVTSDSGEWFYRLAGSDYRRPFGIDVFGRARNPQNVEYDMGSMRLGYQSDVSENPAVTSLVVPADQIRQYINIWWDFCLVMDPEVDTIEDKTYFRGTDYFIQASNISYTADLTLTISMVTGLGTPEETVNKSVSFPVHLEGFYKPDEYDKTMVTASFSISRIAEVLQLDGAGGLLENMKASPATANDFTTIATYSLSSSSLQTSQNETRKVRMFLSSTNDAIKSTGGRFVLRHEDNDNVSAGTAPQLLFKAALTSESKGHAPSSEAKTVVFDGTDRFIPKEGNTSYVLPGNYLEIDATTTKQKTNIWYSSWLDSGSIGIVLTGEVIPPGETEPVTATDWTNQGAYTVGGDTATLTKGEYKSTIYIHVITF